MNLIQQQQNKETGEKIRSARKEKRLTQSGFAIKILDNYINYYEAYLKEKKFSSQEIERYICQPFDELDEALKTKLKNTGIKKSISAIATSTISNYENGIWAIPAWFVEVAKEILGNF